VAVFEVAERHISIIFQNTLTCGTLLDLAALSQHHHVDESNDASACHEATQQQVGTVTQNCRCTEPTLFTL